MGETVISASDISKNFKVYEADTGKGLFGSFKRHYYTKRVLKGVSFEVKRGDITALLGKNGAGKSTLIKILTGILYPDSGSVSVLGMEPHKDRVRLMKDVGVVLGAHAQLYPSLPPIDTFNYMRYMYDIPEKAFGKRLDYLLDVLNLKDVYKRQVRVLSLGERMKCNIISSLLHSPSVVVMDEPLIGVDTLSAFSLRKAMADMRDRYKTTFLISTHITTEVELLAERVLLVDEGTLLFNGAKEKLEGIFGSKKQLKLYFSKRPGIDFSKYGRVLEQKENFARVEIDAKAEKSRRVLDLLRNRDLLDYSVTDPGLDYILNRIYSKSEKRRKRGA